MIGKTTTARMRVGRMMGGEFSRELEIKDFSGDLGMERIGRGAAYGDAR